jgi:hypothetical protein
MAVPLSWYLLWRSPGRSTEIVVAHVIGYSSDFIGGQWSSRFLCRPPEPVHHVVCDALFLFWRQPWTGWRWLRSFGSVERIQNQLIGFWLCGWRQSLQGKPPDPLLYVYRQRADHPFWTATLIVRDLLSVALDNFFNPFVAGHPIRATTLIGIPVSDRVIHPLKGDFRLDSGPFCISPCLCGKSLVLRPYPVTSNGIFYAGTFTGNVGF